MMFNSHSNNAAMKAEPQTTTTTATITSAEDEALKRNTDCVYFLASPLTCKKGAECEYRHSEEARMNPRDCWYWMNGNCLNPKCSFRHPPLDGLLGTSAPISGKPTLPPAQTIAPVQSSAVLNSAPGKQATACYYYQKGLCLKGDRCPFMHGSQSFDNQAPQAPGPKVTAPVAQPQMLKMDFGGLQRCTREKNPQANIAKPIEASAARPPTKAAPANNGFATEKRMSSSAIQVTSAEHSRNKPVQLSPIISRNSAFISGNSASRNHSRQVQPLDDRNFRNVKEPDEFLAESSPGFDVLVDDELRDSDYYQNEEEFRRMTGHGGKHPNNMNEFEYERSADYSLANFEREKFSDPRSYDRYGRAQEQYAWEQRRVSSERISDMSHVPDRRGHPRSESPDQIDESDLRFRLSKHRKINGSRSATSPDRRSDLYRRDDRGRHVENQRNRNHNRRDSHHLPPQESSISNRLQGRISVLGRSSPDRNHNDSHRERGMDRSRARLSPGRPSLTSYRGKSQESIKHRIQEDFTAEGRNFRGSLIRRDDLDYDTPDFAPPKRLAELKGPRVCEHDEEQQTKGKQIPSLGERTNMRIGRLVGHQELEGSISFEGPKPLSEILKRKRGDDISSGNKEERNRKREEDQVSEKPSHVSSHVNQAPSSKEENKFAAGNSFVEADDDEEEGLIPAENAELTNNKGHISVPSGQKHETDDMLPDKTTENENEYDQGEEEFEYEQEAGEEENADPEDEYLDDEDDFAKKIGVMFS